MEQLSFFPEISKEEYEEIQREVAKELFCYRVLKECENVKIGKKDYEVSSFSLEYSETRNENNKRDSELIVLLKTKNS